MTATVILNSEEVNFKEFEMRCSLVDTGTGKVLCSDNCNVDSCSAQDSRVTTTTADTHALKAKNTGTLTRYVTEVESYVQQIIIVKSVFIDDFLVTGNELVQIENVKQSVATRFALTDEGKPEYYFGGELEYKDQNTLVLHQRGYIKKLLERFGMVDCNPKATSLDVDLNLNLLDCSDEVNAELQSQYRELIGSLMFLYQWTRPDLGYAVTFLSRYLHKPGVKHLTQAKNVLRYLKGTQDYGIHYTRDITRLGLRNQKLNTLYAHSDSDFAGCRDTARSTSGNVILMNAVAISWYSGRQTTTALCTAMAETIALAKVVVKVKYLRAILFDLQCRQVEPTYIHSAIVWVDNTATLAAANGNDFTHETVKHVIVKVRFLQECVQRKIILLAPIRTHQNIADILTKQSPVF